MYASPEIDMLLLSNHLRKVIQLVAKFSGDVFVTRVGIRGKQSYFGRPEVRIAIFVRKGDITTCTVKEKALQYTHFPPHTYGFHINVTYWQIKFEFVVGMIYQGDFFGAFTNLHTIGIKIPMRIEVCFRSSDV